MLTVMDDLCSSSSDRIHRYPQRPTSCGSADRHSNSESESTGLHVDFVDSGSSYVHAEHDDAGTSGESSQAAGSWGDAGRREVQAGLPVQPFQQQSPGYSGHQNNLHADQFGYSQYSTSAYNVPSESGHPSDASDQNEYQAPRPEPGYFNRPYQIPTLDACSSSNELYWQYSAPTAPGYQGRVLEGNDMPYYTQRVHLEVDLPIDIGPPYPTYSQENNNVASAHQHAVVGDGDGPWSAVNRQNNCCQHRLERQINDVEHVLNAPHDPDPIGGGWWACGSDESSRGKITGQQWGGASDITIRSGNIQQSHQVGTSNDPRHPLHLQGLNEFPTAPARPATQTSPLVRSTRTDRGSKSTRTNRRLPTVTSLAATSSSSAPLGKLRCPDCPTEFDGIHGRGNLGRHRRQKHTGKAKSWPCEYHSCNKRYKRSDAMRKHYRQHHAGTQYSKST